MRAVLLVAVLVALTRPALVRVYVCDVLHVYDVESGELVSSRYGTLYHTIVFDDDTGIFKRLCPVMLLSTRFSGRSRSPRPR